MMLVFILIYSKEKKLKEIFYIIFWVSMQWLYILLCANQFIYKYRCLKAKVVKTNFLGNDISKRYALYLHCLQKPSTSLF